MTIPKEPQFGEPLPPITSPETLAFLARRRSASAMALRAPGPTSDQIDDLLRLSVRVPDHGKLFPWRFIILEGQRKAAVGEKLQAIARSRPDQPKATAALGKFNAPPLAICVVSHLVDSDIPEWEQVLSAGAVCVTLVNAATAMGYGANWITDWYSTDQAARAAIGVPAADRVAGMIYIGTPAEPPLERVRPDIRTLVIKP
jgi:nitroreductase